METATFKNIATELLDETGDGRTVRARVSKFGNIDHDGDMMMPGCYKKSIQERGHELFHLSNHRMLPEFVLSKATFEEDKDGLVMTSTLRNTQHAEDILEGYKTGIWSQHSVMFAATKGGYEKKTTTKGETYNEFTEVKLYEGSTVVLGANPDTPTLGLKSFFETEYKSDIKKAFDHLRKLNTAFRKGKFTDEFFPLIEIQIKLIESFIEESQQKSIEPALVTQPQEGKGKELFTQILASLK